MADVTYSTALLIHGWVVNGSGTNPVHRLRNGKFLRGTREGRRIRWPDNPTRADLGPIYTSEYEARMVLQQRRALAAKD